VHLRTQQGGSVENSGLLDVKRILSGMGEDPDLKIRINPKFLYRTRLKIIRTNSFGEDPD